MAARSRFPSDGRDHEHTQGFAFHRSKTYNLLSSRWKSLRRRRIIFALVAGWLLYLFFKNMPTDLPPIAERYDRRYGQLRGGAPGPQLAENRATSPPGISEDYDSPIRYYGLMETLEPHMDVYGSKGDVLFAVSSLRSASQLLPIACSMAQVNRTQVHLAFMGRDFAGWQELKEKNGVEETSCAIFLHDARPDYAAQSSTARLEVSAQASLGHIHSALQLHTVLMVNSEEDFFLQALRTKTSSLGLPLLNLPVGALMSLSWVASLDTTSLWYLDKVQVDIVIQALPDSAASLMRLLRSIKEADYSGWKFPRITVEVPNSIDPFLAKYLSEFQWPPDSKGSESRLVVRRRLDTRLMSPVQASMRTIESFYPLAPGTNHVLMLSPNVELSPNYFQFLMYAVLEYRHGGQHKELAEHLIGISLDLPSVAPDLKTKAPYETHLIEPLVLWQAPASNAALYFGDRWVDLHNFLSRRFLLDAELAQKAPSTPDLSHELPVWLQPMLELMQTRGYYMMYPTFMLKDGSSTVTVHRELAQSPEEYMMEDKAEKSATQPAKHDVVDGRPLTAEAEIALLMKAEQRAFPASLVDPFIQAVYEKYETSAAQEIPLLSFQGELRQWAFSWSIAWKAAEEFAVSVGGCKTYDSDNANIGVASLFCLTGA